MSVAQYVKDLFKNPSKYAKFWTALGAFGLSLVTRHFANADWLPDFLQVAGALGVFVVPNKKG